MKNNSKCEFGAIEAASGKRRKSGRVIHEDGRGVWEWQTSTGVFTRDVSDDHLTRLEISNLRVVDAPPMTAQDPMLETLDRLATPRSANAKPKVIVSNQSKNTLRELFKKWVG